MPKDERHVPPRYNTSLIGKYCNQIYEIHSVVVIFLRFILIMNFYEIWGIVSFALLGQTNADGSFIKCQDLYVHDLGLKFSAML